MSKRSSEVWDCYFPRHPALGKPKPYHFIQHTGADVVVTLHPGHHNTEESTNA